MARSQVRTRLVAGFISALAAAASILLLKLLFFDQQLGFPQGFMICMIFVWAGVFLAGSELWFGFGSPRFRKLASMFIGLCLIAFSLVLAWRMFE